jgi:glycosyltransferase involved in cell wall biosynthesis
MERLRAVARGLGVEQRVHFAGYRRDVPRLLGALDLYVHPARFEGMPNALLEAMAAGCPIIASAVDGNRELIEDGVNGWLVPPEDVDALSRAIESALLDGDAALQRGAAAQQRAATEFGVEAVVTAWEAALAGQSGQSDMQ